MWIQVRSMDGKRSERINGLSKLTKIEDLRRILVKLFDAPADRQRLFYRGKQLEDTHTLFDYNVNVNDIVQIMIRSSSMVESGVANRSDEKSDGGYESSCSTNISVEEERDGKTTETTGAKEDSPDESLPQCNYYKVGDFVDAKDPETGSWFEAKVLKISRAMCKAQQEVEPNNNEVQPNEGDGRDSAATGNRVLSRSKITRKKCIDCQGSSEVNHMCYVYHISFDGYEDQDITRLRFQDIRPRARSLIHFDDIKIGDVIMVNYNIDNPQDRGFWFDACITSTGWKEMTGTVLVGIDYVPLINCKIGVNQEIFKIESPVPLTQRSSEMERLMQKNPPPKRTYKPVCSECQDNARRNCKFCACHNCGGKHEPSKQILCDECDFAFHIWCLNPPLEEVPSDDEWYCPTCKNDETEVVRAGEKLKDSKKKAKLASSLNSCTRDWGKGMACVGRTKECTIVPPNHFGSVPGVEVGTQWMYRVQVSEVGIHRPHVAGIHGRAMDGAYSIVLAGGYEDDVDHGDEFTYTGSGGRDLSGNKRTAEQSSDQTLTRMNRALALNCAIPLNNAGGEAEDWKSGRPVRVIRNAKGRKYSTFCPGAGNRYDGLYKVVKYWPETGKSGYLVWRYMLRRDDPSPAPWSKEGLKRISELGLQLQYPDGYLEAKAAAASGGDEPEGCAATPKIKGKASAKRLLSDSTNVASNKKSKPSSRISPDLEVLIVKDNVNERIWKDCSEALAEGMQNFVKVVEERFQCVCCQEVVFKPVTTICKHNICKSCLSRSFKAGVFSCPVCRRDLGKNCPLESNVTLQRILQLVMPGYEKGR